MDPAHIDAHTVDKKQEYAVPYFSHLSFVVPGRFQPQCTHRNQTIPLGQRQRARRPSRVAIPTMLEGEAAYIALSVAISSAVSANEESARSSAMYTGFSPGLVVI